MQYLLTEDEYEEFQNCKKQLRNVPNSYDLLKLCILAAEHIPVITRFGDSEEQPWGCALSDIIDKQNSLHWYDVLCDECPAESICSYEFKEYSK